MILDQDRAVLVGSVICFQKIFGVHGLNHQNVEEKKLRCERVAIFAENNINHQLHNLQVSQGPLLIFLPVSPITVAALLASTRAGIPHTLVSSKQDLFSIWIFRKGYVWMEGV